MSLLGIRPGERRDTWAAFATLFGFLASQAILETARDALFLAKVPATRLPFVYLAIALLSLLVANAQSKIAHKLSGRPALAVWTLVAAAITFGFWILFGRLGPSGVYALYVWSGVLTTLVLVHFWTLIGNIFSVTQAKRVYGIIGAGSVLGAIVGSGLASALARLFPPQQLLLASAAGFALTALVPLLFRNAAQAADARPTHDEAPSSFLDSARYVVRQPYTRHVVILIFVSAGCLTVADYLFKSMVAARIPKEDLGAFLGTVSFALNVLSLFCQLALVGRILRRFTLTTALAFLPALLFLGGLGVVATATLTAALFIKTADGGLRYSLHRTGSELLFLPFSDEARRKVKAFIDVVGQRGGQALASIAILLFAAWKAPVQVLAAALGVLSLGWIAASLVLRAPYLEVFRSRLQTGRTLHFGDFPELDVASLETLIAALDSERDAEVIAALGVLEREAKVHLIPALILYHPADEVVERALEIFTHAGRKNVVHVIDRLIEHPSPRVRAATIAARSVLAPDPQRLLMRMSFEESQEVRATIVVNLIASGEIFGTDAKERIEALLKRGTPATKIALAHAIARRGADGFTDVLVALANVREIEVRRAAISAMGRINKPVFVPALIDLLGDELTRPHATKVLVSLGNEALAPLVEALRDRARKAPVRRRLPIAIGLLDPELASAELLGWLPKESDGGVRYQIIRALEAMLRRKPSLSLDRTTLDLTIRSTVSRAYRYLDRRSILTRGAVAEPKRKTPGHELLERLLHDKEDNAIERLFRLLGLAHPTEDFAQIHRGLRSGLKEARATSMELIENILSEPLRAAVIGLVDDLPDAERLAVSGRFHVLLDLD